MSAKVKICVECDHWGCDVSVDCLGDVLIKDRTCYDGTSEQYVELSPDLPDDWRTEYDVRCVRYKCPEHQ